MDYFFFGIYDWHDDKIDEFRHTWPKFWEFNETDMKFLNAEFTLYMTNFLGFEKSDMLTKMVEFSLHMTNFLGIW